MHRRLVYIYLLNVPSFSSRYFNKIKRTSRLGRLLALSLEILCKVCNCSLFCCTLLYVHSSIAIILMGKRELIALLNLSSLCLVMIERLFHTVPRGCLQFVIVVFPDHTHLLFLDKALDFFTRIKFL